MKTLKAKIIMILVAFLFIFFFSNDFGLIDVEKTSIITAIAIDKTDDGDFEVTAQIAVPEATDANTENQKAQLSGKGSTVGAALKDLGDTSGWFPKLAFCNLILIGSSLSQTNVITAIDYFAKTLRVQDSALVAFSQKSAKELLEISTPLDNLSAFALQKILLKSTGFDRDIISTDVKSFCADYYSIANSSYMPLIKILDSGGSSESSGQGSSSGGASDTSGQSGGQSSQSSGQKNKENLFDARSTALFVEGVKVGELGDNETLALNAILSNINGTSLSVDEVPDKNGKPTNYLLTVLKNKRKTKLTATNNSLDLYIDLSLYCKVADHSSSNSDEAISQNHPLSQPLIEKTENMLIEYLENMMQISRRTGCDFLKIKEKLYRYNYKQYSLYKDNFLSKVKTHINVSVFGQS
ncbi:MAG: hypothetical protein IKB67_04330 [Clostridia bacterium]|nr:hypothetical protein [Clostridia bacterium]